MYLLTNLSSPMCIKLSVCANSLLPTECVCDPRGTQQSRSDPTLLLCDQVTGLCECQDNIGGDMCNICDVSYSRLTQ